jgi:hypothetical protein
MIREALAVINRTTDCWPYSTESDGWRERVHFSWRISGEPVRNAGSPLKVDLLQLSAGPQIASQVTTSFLAAYHPHGSS